MSVEAAADSALEGAGKSDGGVVARLATLPGVSTASGLATAEHAQLTGRTLPVSTALTRLLPLGGLRRGSTVVVWRSRSLLLALLAEATAHGSWAAIVGIPDIGVVAAQELGVEVSRLVLVPCPGADVASVASALIDGMDLVVVGSSCTQRESRMARWLSGRARHRGAVLLSLGHWPGAETELRCETKSWVGLDSAFPGHGYLRERKVVVHAVGRGASARPVRVELLLPGSAGSPAEPKEPEEAGDARHLLVGLEAG